MTFAIVTGCASFNRSTAPVTRQHAEDDGAVSGASSHPTILRPGFSVSVTVLVAGCEEINESNKRISQTGDISLPLLGAVDLANQSLSEATQTLQTLYGQYFVAPQVIIDFSGSDSGVSPWGQVVVLGRVKKTGPVAIPATRDLTVSGVIQRAGGFASSARDNAIRVTRRLPDGQTQTMEVNLRSVGSRGQIEQDIVLQPDDVVFVPEQIF